MELRGCNRMHYISVIRGSEVIKVPNIARGMPNLKIMNIEEIYSAIDSRCHDALAHCPPKVDRSLAVAMTCGFQVKTEVQSEGEEEDDGLDYDAMTLRQLHNVSKCKSHKRKVLESVNLITVKQEVNDLLCDEVEPDMTETLGSLRKALNKSKTKKKRISSSKIIKPLKIKVEDAEHDLSQLQDRSLSSNDNPGHSTSDTVRAIEPSSPDQDLDTTLGTLGNLQSNVLDQSSHNPFVQSVPIQNSICCLNQVSFEHLDHDELQNPIISKHPKIDESIKVETALNIDDQSLGLYSLEDRRGKDMTDLMTCDVPVKPALSEHGSSDSQDHHLHHPFPIQPLFDGNTSSEIQVPCMGTNIDTTNVDITNPSEAAVKDNQAIKSEVMRTSSIETNAMVRFDNYKNELVDQPPERLFSARKTISPNSKEKLCRAMNLAELQDDTQNLSCKEKLLFESNCVDTSRPSVKRSRIIFTSKRTEALCPTKIKANSRQTTKKGKYERNISFVKGNGKGPHDSPSIHAGSRCNSSLSCSQNAIAFSQQQMIDTERLATKLLTELHSMKEIVVDTLHSESRTCTTSRDNMDKARVAIENVKKVEESTKRWLSMMSRDCNRFCKILEEVEKNGSSLRKSNDNDTQESCKDRPSKDTHETQQEELTVKRSAQKERKIMFADEVGETLCHVRVLTERQEQHV